MTVLKVHASACDSELMVQSDEIRRAFVSRLRLALAQAGFPEWGAGARLAEIARATPKAASKWLNAESMPSRAKMEAIAEALKVRVEWLEYGEGSQSPSAAEEMYNVQPASQHPAQARAASLAAIASPRSQEVLARIAKAAEDGRLTEDDLLLLERIAARFEQAPTHAPAPERGSNTRLRERLRKNDPNAQQ